MHNGMSLKPVIAAIGVVALAPAAFAQDATLDQLVTADHEREIIVSAKPDPEPEVREAKQQARSITRAANIFDEPLPLYQKPLCPGVSGLPLDLSMLIADRIRYNAERIGLRLAEGGNCDPNLIVAFVIDGQKALREMNRKPNTILAPLPAPEKKALLRNPGPVHNWIVWSLRTRDGMIVNEDVNQQYSIVRTQSANSLFLQPSRKEIEIAAVLIDIPAIDGMSAVQIADYATMRGLAKTWPVEGDATYATILNLFDDEASHSLELTSFDLAYLKTLYGGPPNIAAAQKLGTVAGAMDKELAAQAAEAGLKE